MSMRLVLLVIATLFWNARAATQVGVLQRGDVFELSVVFGEALDPSSAMSLENYVIAHGELEAVRMAATNSGVTLTATNLAADTSGSLSVSGLLAFDGTELPPEFLTFEVGHYLWTTIGGLELDLPPEATAISTNGFDLYSGGIQQKLDYDEATFAGELVNGDFDRIVRVHYVEPAGLGAKAGLIVRESLDEGKQRPLDPDDPTQWFSAFVELAVSANTSALGEEGVRSHSLSRRVGSGQQLIEDLPVSDDLPPNFPNEWLKVTRREQLFTFFRSTNGVDWVQIGTNQFLDPFPSQAYVGVAFSPQNDDIPPGSGLRKSFVAKFRDYGGSTKVESKLFVQLVGNQAHLSWIGPGTLESAPTVLGTWETAGSQQNPQDVALTGDVRFFRLRSN